MFNSIFETQLYKYMHLNLLQIHHLLQIHDEFAMNSKFFYIKNCFVCFSNIELIMDQVKIWASLTTSCLPSLHLTELLKLML